MEDIIGMSLQINQMEEMIDKLKSDNEDLKYYYLELVKDYAIVLSQEGYAKKSDIETNWIDKIKYL